MEELVLCEKCRRILWIDYEKEKGDSVGYIDIDMDDFEKDGKIEIRKVKGCLYDDRYGKKRPYIVVCDCGRIIDVDEKKMIGELKVNPEYYSDEALEIVLTFVKDACGSYDYEEV